MSALTEDLATRLMAALRPLGSLMTYRTVETVQARAGANAAIGATTLTLTGGTPAAGDTFSVGGPAVKTITSVAGGVANFAPALTAAVSAGAAVPLTRETTYSVFGWEESTDLRSSATLVREGDRLVQIVADTLPVTPKAGDRIVIGADTLNVSSASTDAIKACWRVIARKV